MLQWLNSYKAVCQVFCTIKNKSWLKKPTHGDAIQTLEVYIQVDSINEMFVKKI